MLLVWEKKHWQLKIKKIIKKKKKKKKTPHDSGLLIKGVRKIFKNEEKEQESRFLRLLLGTLGASLLRNMLACKGTSKGVELNLEL